MQRFTAVAADDGGGWELARGKLRGLALTVDAVRRSTNERVVATRAFTRTTTEVRLSGSGAEGAGEDVALAADDHARWPDDGALLELLGPAGTLGAALDALDSAELWTDEPSGELARRQRRWALDSAVLDLALRQAGAALADVVGRPARPVRFVASFRLGEPPSFDRVRERLEAHPGLRLKLDPTSDWPPELFEAVAATGAVDVIDLKGAYRGTMVDQEPDPVLYRRAAEAFPNALIEDPALDEPETAAALEGHTDRIAWDAPVRSAADLDALPAPPAAINVKPSRIGALGDLLGLYEECERRGIPTYGGGQFELGVGRRQLQALAASFHPDAPNDVAPTEYNEPRPDPGLPRSPLPAPAGPGFG
jgi:hypothetical protein